MTAKRVVGVVAAAILAAPVARATAADTVLWVNGTESIVPVKSSGTAPSSPPALLHGAFGSDPVITVPYPASFWPLTAVADPTGPTLGTSVRIGIAALGTAIRTTPGPLVVIGTSQGSLVVDDQQSTLDHSADRPPASSVAFIATADPQGPTGIFTVLLPVGTYIPVLNYTVQAAPTDSPYDTTEVNYQYDGIGDFPDRPWDLVADANALLGALYLHPATPGVNLSTVPPSSITTTTNKAGGTVTSYLVPAPYLPLTEPLTQLGVPAPVVNALDGLLKPVIDAGYSAATPNDGPYLSHGQLVTAPPNPLVRPGPKPPPAATAANFAAHQGKSPGTAIAWHPRRARPATRDRSGSESGLRVHGLG